MNRTRKQREELNKKYDIDMNKTAADMLIKKEIEELQEAFNKACSCQENKLKEFVTCKFIGGAHIFEDEDFDDMIKILKIIRDNTEDIDKKFGANGEKSLLEELLEAGFTKQILRYICTILEELKLIELGNAYLSCWMDITEYGIEILKDEITPFYLKMIETSD